MDFEQYFQQAVIQNDEQAEHSFEKWKSVSDMVTDPADPSSNFECNICFDFVQDPVVTLCGHLYCWPCIYKWLHSRTISNENGKQSRQQCPVCKAEVSDATLVPLYGRGTMTKASEGKTQKNDSVIPRRPPGPANWDSLLSSASSINRPVHQFHDRPYLHQPRSYYPHPGSYSASPVLNLGGVNGTNTIHPIVLMFGEMVLERVLGNSVTNIYHYPNSYHLAGSSNPRVRRHLMQADRALGRISFFLFCCTMLCLFLF